MHWIHLRSKGITGINWWMTLHKSPAPSWLGWTQALLPWASLQLEGKHFQNLLSGKDKFSICSSPLPWRQEVHKLRAQTKTRWCLLWSCSTMTLVMTTSSPLQGLCLQDVSSGEDHTGIWYAEGDGCAPILSCSYTSFMRTFLPFALAVVSHSSPALTAPSSLSLVTPDHGALNFHPFPLRAWSGAYPPNSHYPLLVLKSAFSSTCCALAHPPQSLMANEEKLF